MNRSTKLLPLLAVCCATCVCINAQIFSMASAPAPGADASCTLTTELEEGPYYLDDQLFRSNISEGQAGIPLLLRIRVADTDCEPIVDAFVDIWHCNSTGFYSGFTLSGEDGGSMGAMAFSPTGAPAGQEAPEYSEGGAPQGSPDGTTSVAAGVSAEAAAAGQVTATTDDYTWLRGTQQTDEDGMVEFETIVPGWYAGRTAHIHLKVHVPYNTSIVDQQEEFDDSHVAHIAQFFFDASLYDQIAGTYPYTLDLTTRTTNPEDRIYNADPSAVLGISWLGSSLEDGLVATITSHIDPSSTPAAGI